MAPPDPDPSTWARSASDWRNNPAPGKGCASHATLRCQPAEREPGSQERPDRVERSEPRSGALDGWAERSYSGMPSREWREVDHIDAERACFCGCGAFRVVSSRVLWCSWRSVGCRRARRLRRGASGGWLAVPPPARGATDAARPRPRPTTPGRTLRNGYPLGKSSRSTRTAVSITSSVIRTALPTHHWQIALIVNSSR